MFRERYGDVFKGDANWQAIAGRPAARPMTGTSSSTYVQNPPYFEGMTHDAGSRSPTSTGARILALFGDSITTDHISPAGSIKQRQPGRRVPDRAPGRARATSTPTARGAATTK